MKARREGFGMVEVVVSIVLMAIVLISLAGLTMATARQARAAEVATTRQAITLQMVNRFATLPYANLPAAAGCDTVGPVNRQFRRCVTATVAGTATTVQVVTTPLPPQQNTSALTMRIVRSAPPVGNPLCIGC